MMLSEQHLLVVTYSLLCFVDSNQSLSLQARETGKERNHWLLVNVQNVREFACQALNRDVWSNSAVKEVVREHFVLWQVRSGKFLIVQS